MLLMRSSLPIHTPAHQATPYEFLLRKGLTMEASCLTEQSANPDAAAKAHLLPLPCQRTPPAPGRAGHVPETVPVVLTRARFTCRAPGNRSGAKRTMHPQDVPETVRVQVFLDMLVGTFDAAWGNPERLEGAVASLVHSTAGSNGKYPELLRKQQPLLRYLRAVLDPLGEDSQISDPPFNLSKAQQTVKDHVVGSTARTPSDPVATITGQEWLQANGPPLLLSSSRGLSSVHRDLQALPHDGESEEVKDGGRALPSPSPAAPLPRSRSVGRIYGAPIVGGDVLLRSTRVKLLGQRVLMDDALLHCLLPYLLGDNGRQSVRALCQLALVCRKWRDVAGADAFWTDVERQALPSLWREGKEASEGKGKGAALFPSTPSKAGKAGAGKGAGGARGRVLSFGRLLVQDRRVWCGGEWRQGLELQFEVFDRTDGLHLLSASGPMHLLVNAAAGVTIMGLSKGPRVEVRGPPFSAASRAPCSEVRVGSMREWLEKGGGAALPSGLCVRVVVRDVCSGRMALLWQEGRGARRRVTAPAHYWQGWLPEGSLEVALQDDELHQHITTTTSMHSERIQGGVSFYVCPEPCPEGARVGPAEQLWRLAGGEAERYDLHISPITLHWNTRDVTKISGLIRALLNT